MFDVFQNVLAEIRHGLRMWNLCRLMQMLGLR